MPLLTLVAWFLAPPSAVALGYWAVVAWRIRRVAGRRWSVRQGLDLPAPPRGWPKLSIIIPVHNEQRVIDACARSLRAQRYEPMEIIFVLDRCTDQTPAILQRHAAEDDRIVLIHNDACPPDWAGKCNAARLGAERAEGERLLFTDADTAWDPQLARAAVALAAERGCPLLSLLSTLTTDRRFERIVQPVASMNLLRMYPIDRVDRPRRARPFANGQFMLFDASWYERIGGHEGVKDDLLEDIAFARAVHRAGGRCGVFLADDMLTCSMYDSLESFKVGWRRIFIEACRREPRRLRKNAVRLLVNGFAVPAVQAAALIVGLVLLLTAADLPMGLACVLLVVAGWGCQLASLLWIHRLGGAPRIAALAYPAGCWIVSRIMFAAARDLAERRPVKWGGREYILEPRY